MKKIILGLLGIAIMICLASCGAQTGARTSGQAGQDFMNSDPASLPVERKLGIGTLKLEGTDLAVTAEQARNLLPLWKAMKALSSDNNTTAEEINALNRQIEESMNPEQVQAIKDMTWTSDDLRSLFRPAGENEAGGQAQGMSAQGSNSSRRNNSGGFPGGGPPEGFGGMMGPGGGAPGGMQNPAASRTAVPGQAERRAAAGMNLMFVDQVILLLETKIQG